MINKTYSLKSAYNSLFLDGGRGLEPWFFIRDEENHNYSKGSILERYLSDIHVMFMTRFSAFIGGVGTSAEDIKKLKSLLDEIIRVKILLEECEECIKERTQ